MKQQILRNSSLIVLAVGVCSGLSYAQSSDNDENSGNWDISVGIGAQNEPITPGVDEYEVQVLPYLDITYKDRYFLNGQYGLGGYIYQHEDKESSLFEDLAIGIALDFDEGRDPADLTSRPGLQGLNQIDATLEGKIFAEAEVSFVELGVELAQDLADGHNGWYAEFSAEVDLPIGDRFFLSAGPSFRYSGEDFQQSYYGVDALESIATGLAEFTPEAGFDRATFSITGAYALTDHWQILGQVEYEQLLGDAADSPFVEEEGQIVTGLAIAYNF